MMLLRSTAFNAWFYGLTFVLAVWHWAFTHRTAALAGAGRHWALLVLAGLRHICGIDFVVTGREHLPADGAALIAPMHQSAFDTVVWFLLVPDCTYVLKRELIRVPVFGRLALRLSMIPVDRTAGAGALRDLIRRSEAAVAAGRQIVIFPEGTRMAPGAPLRLHPGVAAIAARTGLPIIPVATDSGHHWGRRAFFKRPGTIHVAILPPLPTGLKRDALMTGLAAAYAGEYAALALVNPVDKSVHHPTAYL
jgi:1-acyl-sn-glycerol-3-phosphate acyltransferase